MAIEAVQNIQITFGEREGRALHVTIDTEHLHLKSPKSNAKYHERYFSLFGNPEVMHLYLDGQVWDMERVKNRVDQLWSKRWDNGDPYSAFAVFLKPLEKGQKKEFIGHIVLGHGDEPGVGVLGGLGVPAHWNKKYGTEALKALIAYARETKVRGYELDGKPLELITATVSDANIGSKKVMQKAGMACDEKAGEPGVAKKSFSLKV